MDISEARAPTADSSCLSPLAQQRKHDSLASVLSSASTQHYSRKLQSFSLRGKIPGLCLHSWEAPGVAQTFKVLKCSLRSLTVPFWVGGDLVNKIIGMFPLHAGPDSVPSPEKCDCDSQVCDTSTY